MVVTGKNPYTPGMEGGCTKTAYEAWGKQCMTKDPCTTCKYWPIYPIKLLLNNPVYSNQLNKD